MSTAIGEIRQRFNEPLREEGALLIDNLDTYHDFRDEIKELVELSASQYNLKKDKFFILSKEIESFYYHDDTQISQIQVVSFQTTDPKNLARAMNHQLETQKEFIQEEQFGVYLDSVQVQAPKLMIFALQSVIDLIPEDQKFDIIEEVYTSMDYLLAFLPQDLYQKLFGNIGLDKQAMSLEKIKQYLGIDTLPEELTIYRGAGKNSTPLETALSWTLDPSKTMLFFMNVSGAYWVKATVKTSDVLYFTNDSNEAELWIAPNSATIVEHNRQFSEEDLLKVMGSDRYSKGIELFTFARRNFGEHDTEILGWLGVKTTFQNTRIHDEVHTARVIFAMHLITYLSDLDLDTTALLMFASAIHDHMKKNDDEDPKHGARAKRAWIKALGNGKRDWKKITASLNAIFETATRSGHIPDIRFKESDVEAMFSAVELHDVDDEIAFGTLKRRFSKERLERAELMLSALKDADALDRMRINDLSLDYLRLDATKQAVQLFYIARTAIH